MELRTRAFRLSQIELVRLTSQQYVRGFWWAIVGVPLFGLIGLLWGPNRIVQVFSMMCVLWPISIPARAILLTRKAARQYREETVAAVEEGDLRLYRPSGKGTRLALTSIWSVEDGEYGILIRTRKLGFLMLPARAFEDRAHQSRFAASLRERSS